MTLGETEQDAIREAFAELERDVEVRLEVGPAATPVTLLAAGGRELDSNTITRDIVEAVCALGSLQRTVANSAGVPGEGHAGGVARLTVVEHDEPGPWPRTTIGPGLVYRGMPLGYELTTLVHAIVEAGRAEPTLSAASRERLDDLAEDVTIDVFVTPT